MSSLPSKKILLVSPFTGISGSAIRYVNIAKQLKRHGYSVIYVERESPHTTLPPIDNEIPTYRCKVSGNVYLDILRSLFFNLKILLLHWDLSVFFALKPAPNNCIPALIAKVFNKRIILDIDDLDFGYFPIGIKRSISQFFFNFFPRFFPLITCHTQSLKDYIINTLHIPEKRTYFLAQGISDVFLDFNRLPENPPKSIVYSATLGITSDFPDLMPVFIAVVKRHPDVRINIIGDGVKRKEFERLSANEGLTDNIHFHGWVTHEDLPALLAQNWVGINYMKPSFTNQCRAVLKIREYLAVGLQVVCNDVGDVGLFDKFIHVESSLSLYENKICELLSEKYDYNNQGRLFINDNFKWKEIVDDFLWHIRE